MVQNPLVWNKKAMSRVLCKPVRKSVNCRANLDFERYLGIKLSGKGKRSDN
jgi:hypothetical protein